MRILQLQILIITCDNVKRHLISQSVGLLVSTFTIFSPSYFRFEINRISGEWKTKVSLCMATFDKEKKDMSLVNCFQELMKTKVKRRKTLLKY